MNFKDSLNRRTQILLPPATREEITDATARWRDRGNEISRLPSERVDRVNEVRCMSHPAIIDPLVMR